MDTQAAWEALHICHHEIHQEAAALEACEARLRNDEATLAGLQERTKDECSELVARCQAAHERRLQEEAIARKLSVELATARAKLGAETQAAREADRRAQAAFAARDQTMVGLRRHEDLAVRTLKDAVSRLEHDFAIERADYAQRDQLATMQLRDLERQLDQRRRQGGLNAGLPPAGLWA